MSYVVITCSEPEASNFERSEFIHESGYTPNVAKPELSATTLNFPNRLPPNNPLSNHHLGIILD